MCFEKEPKETEFYFLAPYLSCWKDKSAFLFKNTEDTSWTADMTCLRFMTKIDIPLEISNTDFVS